MVSKPCTSSWRGTMRLVCWVCGRLGWLLRQVKLPQESTDLRVWRQIREPLSWSSQESHPGLGDRAAPHPLSPSTTEGKFECFLKLSQFSLQNAHLLKLVILWNECRVWGKPPFFSRLQFLSWGKRWQICQGREFRWGPEHPWQTLCLWSCWLLCSWVFALWVSLFC